MTRRRFLASAAAVFAMPTTTRATTPVTIRGRLDATEEEAAQGRFTLNAAQLDAPLVIETPAESYLQMYFDGCVGHDVTLTVTPQ